LAVHEGDIRPALPIPIRYACLIGKLILNTILVPRLYFLGKEALVEKKEAVVAVGNSCWSSCWHRTYSWHIDTSPSDWSAGLGGKEDSWQISELRPPSEKPCHHFRGDCKYSRHPCSCRARRVHRRPHIIGLCLWSCSYLAMQVH